MTGRDRLSELIAHSRDDVGSDAEMAEIQSALEAALPGPPGGGGSGGGSAMGSGTTWLKVSVAAVFTVGVVTTSIWWGSPDEPSHHGPQAELVEPVPAMPPEDALRREAVRTGMHAPQMETPPMIDDVVLLRESHPEEDPTARARTTVVGSTQGTRTVEAPPRSEAELLDEARAALSVTPGAALSLTATHQRSYPDGFLTEEREVIAIRALLSLGRTEPARERFERFSQRFPASAHSRRLRAMFARAHAAEGD